MSLRLFHVIFIVASILLSLFAGVWGVWLYTTTGAASGLGFAAVFVALGVALVVYGFKTFQKLKELA